MEVGDNGDIKMNKKYNEEFMMKVKQINDNLASSIEHASTEGYLSYSGSVADALDFVKVVFNQNCGGFRDEFREAVNADPSLVIDACPFALLLIDEPSEVICEQVVAKDVKAVSCVPRNRLTHDVCVEAIRSDVSYAIDFIESDYQSSEMWVEALSGRSDLTPEVRLSMIDKSREEVMIRHVNKEPLGFIKNNDALRSMVEHKINTIKRDLEVEMSQPGGAKVRTPITKEHNTARAKVKEVYTVAKQRMVDIFGEDHLFRSTIDETLSYADNAVKVSIYGDAFNDLHDIINENSSEFIDICPFVISVIDEPSDDLCIKAINLDSRALAYIPSGSLNHNVCVAGICRDPLCFYNTVDTQYQTPEMWMEGLSGSADLPNETRLGMINKALTREVDYMAGITAIDCIRDREFLGPMIYSKLCSEKDRFDAELTNVNIIVPDSDNSNTKRNEFDVKFDLEL